MAELLIYRASAGSGKTHILVTRYIQWALSYPDAFKHILAVTFTNRATQEMKERILSYLYSLSIGEETDLHKTLCQAGWLPAQLQARSKETLSMMVYHYGDFSVTTIDSFFHKVIQSFATSIGLPHHFSIEMNESLALKETIEELFALDDPLLQKWMVDFALAKLLAGKSWNIKRNIQELGKSLFNESFKLYEKALLRAFEQKEAWPDFVFATQKRLYTFEQQMQIIGQRALKIIEKEGLTPEDFSYGTKGVIGYFSKIANKIDFKPTKRAFIAKDNLKSWSNKVKTNNIAHIARVVDTLLHPLLIKAIDLYEEEGQAYRTAIVGSRFSYAFGMIGALLIGLEKYRLKNNLLFMSDISALLYQAIQESDTPSVYEKIGNQFHHFLIDEFQDLSLFQWINIKPLLCNSLAEGYNSLLVGDVKQSIYRWRGSNWKLLNHQVEAAFKESTIHYLATNRRSQEAIVLFNNYFFKRAAAQLVDHLEKEVAFDSIDKWSYELSQIRGAYSDVVQQPSAKKGGSVELFFFRSDQIDETGHPISWKSHVQSTFITLLNQLQKKGISAKDMVVLVRNNSEANLIASWLKTNDTTSAYQLRSDHGDFLGNHIAIRVLIHTLYYLTNEKDLINKLAWIEAYWGCIEHDLDMGQHDRFQTALNDPSGRPKLFPESFWAQKDFCKNVSIYTCVHLLIECLFKRQNKFGDVLAFFESIVLNFFFTESPSIEGFLLWWDKRGRSIKLPTKHDENVIRVMTIHQSKGLEFKIVIIPFCNWSLDHPPQNGPILWSVNHHQSTHFPIWPVGYGVDLKSTYYAQDYYLEHIQIHLDNLNLLYVAFTRAETELYIMAPLPDKIEGIHTIADLLYQSLIKERIDGLYDEEVPLVVDLEETGRKFCFRSV